VNLFLLARLLSKSNRGVEEGLEFFQPLFGVDVSYKCIERLYSDPEVKLALHNVFVLLFKEEGTTGDLAGDGTGYSVRVESHYRTEKTPKKRGKKYLHFLLSNRSWHGDVCWLRHIEPVGDGCFLRGS
jgi:transposase